MKPVLEEIFDVSLEYKSQDTRNIQSGVEVLKIFSLTDDELLSKENKTKILNKIFDLPEDAAGDPAKPPAVSVVAAVQPGVAPPVPPKAPVTQ